MPGSKTLAEQIAVDVPLYTPLDAARYLRAPIWFVLSLSSRHPRHPRDLLERFWYEPYRYEQLVDDYGPFFQEERAERISFRSLVSLFVLSAAFRPVLTEMRFPRWHPMDFFHFCDNGHHAARNDFDDPRLFSDPEWVLKRFEHFIQDVPKQDRKHLLKLIALHQTRVESRDGIPVQFFPFSRDLTPDAPRCVVIDPELRFGRPTVKGAPTDVLVERWRAGDPAAELAEDYGLTTDEVEEALRYEATPTQSLFFPFPPFGW